MHPRFRSMTHLSFAFLGLSLLALLLALNGNTASGAALVVNLDGDTNVNDTNPGDGVCDFDSGTTGSQCALRTAIQEADALSGADSISFDPSVTMITLTAGLPPVISNDGLTIDGNDAVTVSGGGMFYVFATGMAGASLTLQDITVTNGGQSAIFNNGTLVINSSTVKDSNNQSDGGALANFDSGTATITDTTFSGSSSLNGSGGSIDNEGVMTINSSNISGSHANMNGGGIANQRAATLTLNSTTVNAETTDGNGGGIYNAVSTLTLNNSTVSDSMATTSAGGIWNNGTATLNDSTVSGNGSAFVAGILNDEGGTLHINNGSSVDHNVSTGNTGGIGNHALTTISDSSISDNQANFGAGINTASPTGDTTLGVTITNSTITGNNAGASGGGIEFARGRLSVTNSEISGNTAVGDGGAIDSFDGGGVIDITDSTLSGNSAGGKGGAIYSGVSGSVLTILRSTLNDNQGGTGGGLRIDFSEANLYNSTISQDKATYGGGIYAGDSSVVTLINTTVTHNQATALGGGVYIPGDITATVNLHNTIIADQVTNTDCDGVGFHSLGNNLDSSGECHLTLPSDRPQTDVFLGPLADNGGPTQTHALLANSNAIDGGDDATCAASPINGIDQRGVSRLQGPHCDIGAYELEVPATPTPTHSPTPTPGTPTATPVQQTEKWGDNDCSGEIDAADVMRGFVYTVLPDKRSADHIEGCPDMGQSIAIIDIGGSGAVPQGAGHLEWGSLLCTGVTDPANELTLLRHIAGLADLPHEGLCPDTGTPVTFD